MLSHALNQLHVLLVVLKPNFFFLFQMVESILIKMNRAVSGFIFSNAFVFSIDWVSGGFGPKVSPELGHCSGLSYFYAPVTSAIPLLC